jgi:hypothetical protein
MTSLPVSSTQKKRFFDTFLSFISFLRLSSFKHDQVCISATTNGTPIVTDASRNEKNKNIQSPTSRCRRSAVRNFIPNLSIEPEKQNVVDISTSIIKQCRQGLYKKPFFEYHLLVY